MKLRNLFFASLAMVTFAACSNDDEPGIENNEPQDASLVVKVEAVSAPSTKAEAGSVTSINESKINDLKLYVYSGQEYFTELTVINNGNLNENAGVTSTSNSINSTEPAYTFTLSGLKTQTVYTFVAIANPHFLESESIKPTESTLEQLLAATQTYNEQFASETAETDPAKKGSFTMVGLYNITADNYLTTATNTATINISRRLAAVQINKITMALPDEVGENFKNATVTLNGIALVNVRSTTQTSSGIQNETTGVDQKLENTSSLINGNIWSTKEPNDANSNLYILYNNKGIALGAAQGGSKTFTTEAKTLNRIYAFPTTDKDLIFKLKLTYSNETLKTEEIRYYNVHLKNNQILNNTIYGIEATIKGVGSKDPDVVEETAGDITTTLNVLPWQVAEVQTVPDLKD